ncbi:hypothetical protein CYG49_03105 [Candidatus Saccharibacteria bacterium]|nr:MAG: hypothetical protein CYG49_03105 [Candidatus Saccharibacteria bacterium]
MNDQTTQHPATDDPELAKVLAGMDEPVHEDSTATSGLQFEETPLGQAPAIPTNTPPVIEPPVSAIAPPNADVAPTTDYSIPVINNSTPAPIINGTSDLEGIKKDALEQLRPLIDHLNLPTAEKFDILLLIIRSTDDQSLLTQAHETAKAIEDESKRAQALLDVIKEIDYFSAQQ